VENRKKEKKRDRLNKGRAMRKRRERKKQEKIRNRI
jgi:hypothetical protein